MRWKLATSGVPLRLGPGVTDLLISVMITVALILTPAIVATWWYFAWYTSRQVKRDRKPAVLEDEKQDQARALTAERVRIARELHDVVAHHMSVISVHSGLASYVFESDPRTARESLATIAETAREGLDEMRRLLCLLREDPEPADARPYDPSSGLAQLDELAARMEAVGVRVGVEVHGTPRPLPPGPDLCAYRVVQESLTNVLKHASQAQATVSVVYGSGSVSVIVTDSGGADGSTVDTGSAGRADRHGLIGMRERAKIYGGSLHAGKLAEGGFQVVLTLPMPSRPEG